LHDDVVNENDTMSPATGEAPPKMIWPGLQYEDARAAIAFLTDVFGFTEALVVSGATEDVVEHSQLMWPEGGGVMLGSKGREGNAYSQHVTGRVGVYVVTDHPDEVHERAIEAGATIFAAPEDTDYGSRSVTVLDPEGNAWTFGTYRGEPAPTS
jgi:uncharacterized glyoxalase superfamily protein PhnB